jgi:hypothetical protein
VTSENYVLVAFPAAQVLGYSSEKVHTRSQFVFKPRYLVVPKTAAPWFLVKDFWVGKSSQFCGGGPVQAECFSGDLEAYSLGRDAPGDFLKKVDLAVPVPLRFDLCTPHYDLCLEVQNLDCNARNFWAVLYGTLVE